VTPHVVVVERGYGALEFDEGVVLVARAKDGFVLYMVVDHDEPRARRMIEGSIVALREYKCYFNGEPYVFEWPGE